MVVWLIEGPGVLGTTSISGWPALPLPTCVLRRKKVLSVNRVEPDHGRRPAMAARQRIVQLAAFAGVRDMWEPGTVAA